MDFKLQQAKEWVEAEKVRELLDKWAVNPSPTSDEVAVLNDVEALLAPPLPTLADMTPEELEACQWMQAQVFPTASALGIITRVDEYARLAIILFADGMAKNVPWDLVTPLPGPKLEWPSLVVSGENETVSVEAEDVTEEPKPGQAWLVEWEGKEYEALVADYSFCPWVLHDPEEVDSYRWCDRYEVTPVRRLRADTKGNA